METFKFSLTARLPTKSTSGAAGYDLFAPEDATIPAHGTLTLGTGVGFVIPKGTYGQIKCRHTLAFYHKVFVFEGVVDSDFRGEVKLLIENRSDENYEIAKHDRIAQILWITVKNAHEHFWGKKKKPSPSRCVVLGAESEGGVRAQNA